jgi:hypothetical protein
MEKFLIEVNQPVRIKLTDNKNVNEECAYVIVIPATKGRGFDIRVDDMTTHVSCRIGDYAGSF